MINLWVNGDHQALVGPFGLELGRHYIPDILGGGLCWETARPSTWPRVKELRNPLAMFLASKFGAPPRNPPFSFPSFFPKFLGSNERLGRK